MSVQGILDRGRDRTESRFTETWKFTRTKMVKDANDIEVEIEIVVYPEVAGQLKFASQVLSEREHAAQLVAVSQRVIKVGVNAAPNVRVGDFATCTASTADAELVGRKFRISGLPEAGQVTAHRFIASEGM